MHELASSIFQQRPFQKLFTLTQAGESVLDFGLGSPLRYGIVPSESFGLPYDSLVSSRARRWWLQGFRFLMPIRGQAGCLLVERELIARVPHECLPLEILCRRNA
jgi:hypothetical protein